MPLRRFYPLLLTASLALPLGCSSGGTSGGGADQCSALSQCCAGLEASEQEPCNQGWQQANTSTDRIAQCSALLDSYVALGDCAPFNAGTGGVGGGLGGSAGTAGASGGVGGIGGGSGGVGGVAGASTGGFGGSTGGVGGSTGGVGGSTGGVGGSTGGVGGSTGGVGGSTGGVGGSTGGVGGSTGGVGGSTGGVGGSTGGTGGSTGGTGGSTGGVGGSTGGVGGSTGGVGGSTGGVGGSTGGVGGSTGGVGGSTGGTGGSTGGTGGSTGGTGGSTGGTGGTGGTTSVKLYFSEYVEGSSNNKALEIFNAGAASVALSTCGLMRYSNGGTTGYSISLAAAGGSLAANDVWVICHSLFVTPSYCDELSSTINHNGNDTYELVCNGVTQDVFGQIGVDPGTAWVSGSVSTIDQTLRRKCTVTTGDKIGTDAFDPALQWSTYAIDTLSGLGSHCN